MNPRKLLFSLLLSLLLMLGVSSAMAVEAETPEEMYIFDDLYLTAYGYAVQTSDGVKDLGYILDAEEANTAGTPLFYCVIENRGDKDQNIKLYIRGGAKYNCYWNKRTVVQAHDYYVFFGSGHKKLTQYSGSWSLDVNGKNVLRFSLGTK